MRGQGLLMQGVAAALFLLLTGCDNGQPAPSVMFTAPSTGMSINLGQSVQASWNAQLATSCTASVSSPMGGAFTGVQAGGAARVVPTAVGSYVYTLRCTGEGGTTISGEMGDEPVRGDHEVEVRDERGRVSTAAVELRFRRMTVHPPIGKRRDYPSLSLTVLEAWAQGVPVLVSRDCTVLTAQVQRSLGGEGVADYASFAAA